MKRLILTILKIIFYLVAFIGWFFFGFFIAVVYNLFKFLEVH